MRGNNLSNIVARLMRRVTTLEAAPAASAGWTLVTSQQLTSDGATMTFTGLSGYRHIKFTYVLGLGTAGADLALSCRVSAGTWRVMQTINSTGASDVQATGTVEINNFNQTTTFKTLYSLYDSSTTAVDNTDAIAGFTDFGNGNMRVANASYQEVWDEIEISASTGDILGTTAGTRGYVYVYGMA